MNNTRFDRTAMKAVHPDFTTRNGFQWAYPGGWTTDPDQLPNPTTEVCPQEQGDGLSVAKTVFGMAQDRYSPVTVLVVGFNDDDVIAEDADKLKIVKGFTVAVIDGIRLIREHGYRADLTGANLTGADLTRANLTRANLYGANLTRANLTRANLTRADLTRANLTGANLYGANLTGANLYGANLTGHDTDSLQRRGAFL